MGVFQDYEPIEWDIVVRDKDVDNNEYVETFHVFLQELSEDQLRLRQKFLGSRSKSDEDSRRGRSSRSRRRDEDIEIQRIRQYNMEASIVGWDFVYPRSYWDRNAKRRVKHPQAQEPIPFTDDTKRKFISTLSGSVGEQINDAIDEINEPPNELPEVRSENGEVLEAAVHSPTEAS